jgi:hypothetical protein
MPRSPLYGRRIHIAGSVADDPALAPREEVEAAGAFVRALVVDLMRRGATFVVPVDADRRRPGDGVPTCFDWHIWEAICGNLAARPTGAPNPLAVAVQHHKTEEQIPADKHALWDGVRGSELVSIDNASHWNMAGKRMEMQARHGDVLITLGGSEGVLFLANLYHQAGKPVIPLNYELCGTDAGSRRLFNQALTSQETERFFRVDGPVAAHDWINRVNFSARHDVARRVSEVVGLLEALARPTVFAVRLLNRKHAEFLAVEDFFTGVVKHVVEQELGFALKVVDGRQVNEHARVDAEIFNRLHHAAVVVADLTGSRPNCFIELGYSLGRSIPTMMTAREGTEFPFDVETLPGHRWSTEHSLEDRRREFLTYWRANLNRPSLVTPEPLVP